MPLFGACAWTPDAYEIRSGATAGAICQFDYLAAGFPSREARAAVQEVRENQKYWYGDFYPLTRASTAPDAWAAYQFYRPDLNAGIVLAFRRGESKYPALEVSLRAINPKATYQVETIDSRARTTKTMTGAELSGPMELRLPAKGSLLIRYSAAKKPATSQAADPIHAVRLADGWPNSERPGQQGQARQMVRRRPAWPNASTAPCRKSSSATAIIPA